MLLGRDYQLFKVSKDEWNKLAENAHLAVFKERRDPSMNTFDYALVVATPTDIYGYATIIEMDAKSAYMQHGGSLPTIRSTAHAKGIYHNMIEWLKERYEHLSTRIENKNLAMLKLAMSEGLLVNGCDCYPDGVFLHLRWAK